MMRPLLVSMEQCERAVEIERENAVGWRIKLHKERVKHVDQQTELKKVLEMKTHELNELHKRYELMQKMRGKMNPN
jgi:2-phosphoglycerate kinase